jgi:hypothetical protein
MWRIKMMRLSKDGDCLEKYTTKDEFKTKQAAEKWLKKNGFKKKKNQWIKDIQKIIRPKNKKPYERLTRYRAEVVKDVPTSFPIASFFTF